MTELQRQGACCLSSGRDRRCPPPEALSEGAQDLQAAKALVARAHIALVSGPSPASSVRNGYRRGGGGELRDATLAIAEFLQHEHEAGVKAPATVALAWQAAAEIRSRQDEGAATPPCGPWHARASDGRHPALRFADRGAWRRFAGLSVELKPRGSQRARLLCKASPARVSFRDAALVLLMSDATG